MARIRSIPSRSAAGQARRRLAACAAIFPFLAAPSCDPEQAERANSKTQLRGLVGELLVSAQAGDATGVDTAVCLDWLARAQAARRQSLGLVSDATDPAVLDGFRARYREAVFARVNDLTRRGSHVDAVDLVRVDLRASDDSGGERLLDGGGPPEDWRIDASGVMGVWLRGRRYDVDVYRVGVRWCLNPVSVQP